MKIDDFLDSPQPNTTKRAGASRIDSFLNDAPGAAGPVVAPVSDPFKPLNATTSSLGAAVSSRALGLVGDLIEGTARIGERGGDWLERRVPLSGLNETQINERQLDPLFRAAEWFKRQQQAINYQPSVDFKRVKADPLNLPQTGRFIVEQGVGSVPDMVAAAVNLPAYILSRTNDVATERAKNEGRPGEVNLADMAKAAPGAIVEATLERFATGRLLPGRVTGVNAASRIGKQTGLQAGTEAVEEVAGYAGETLGTKAGFQPDEALDRGLAGAIVGGPIGGTVQGVSEVVNRQSSGPVEPQRIEPTLDQPAPNMSAALADMIRETATQISPLQQTSTAPSIDAFLNAPESLAETAPDAPPGEPTSPIEAAAAVLEPAPEAVEAPAIEPDVPVIERQIGPEVVAAMSAEALSSAAPEVAAIDAPAAADPSATMQPADTSMDREMQAPARLDGTIAQQLTVVQPGMRPGDIVSARGLPFSNKANAQRVAKDAGPGWRVARSNKGFVVRWQPASDKQIANAKALAKRGSQVDVERDSLFAAIAKMGGISREQLIKEWGADPADLKNLRGAGIYRVATASGRSLDGMGEALGELGFLSLDENGKHDMREFEELFFNELAGQKHYTPLGFQREAEVQRAAEYEEYLNSNDAPSTGKDALPDDAQDIIDEILADDADRLEDDYDRLERDAIQWEADANAVEQTDDDIPGFGVEPVRAEMGGQDERKQPVRQGESRGDTGADQAAEDPRRAQGRVREEGTGSSRSAEGDGQRVEQKRRPYDQKGQLDLFISNGPDPSQAGPAGEAAQREAVAAVDDLYTTGTVLGRALSSDYASRQRVSLVGRKVTGPADLAVLAQVYRDPRFETFRVIFTNSKGDIVSQVGLTSRLPGSASAIIGHNLDEYLADLADTAKNRGASRFYLLHNHPSGIATPSAADESLTRTFADRMPALEFVSHVVIDTNQYATIEADGKWELTERDFGQAAPMVEGEWGGTQVSGPETLMEIAKRLDADKSAITLVVTDHQLRVKRLTTLPGSAIGSDKAGNRRAVLRAAMRAQGAQIFAIGRNRTALDALDGLVVDAIHISDQGLVTSLLATGEITKGELYPEGRRTRVSPDTSPEFGYLRARSIPQRPAGAAGRQSAVREQGPSYEPGSGGTQAEMDLPEPGRKFEPIAIRDFVRAERTATGRREYVAGRKLYDRVSAYATDWLGKLKLTDNKPDAFKTMLRQFKVDQFKAAESAKRIAESGQSLTPEQRVMLSDLLEKQAQVGDVPPEDMVELASAMAAALDVQARELVDLGMISEDRLVKNYLPRLYKHGLAAKLTNPTLLQGWFTKARMRIQGARLRTRGMYVDLPVERVETAKKLGWKVASMTDGSAIPQELIEAFDMSQPVPPNFQRTKVRMWRDYTEAERQEMGEIRDGVLRYAMGFIETQKDIAIGRLFKAIAMNGDLAKTFNPGGWVKVPETDVPGVSGVKAYGALAGMFVEPQVADALRRNTQPKGLLMAAYDKALNFWKEGKTVWNPVAHGNNVVSNLFTAYFAGVNPASPARWRETIREFRTRGSYWNEAVDNGLFGSEFANTEIQNLLMPDFEDMADLESVAASRVAKVVEFSKKYPGRPIAWYRERMQRAYEFEDQFFKLMLYIDRRKAGMEPQAAINDTERYVFNYSDVPEGVELIKRTYSPFFAYTYKAIPMVLHTAMTRPDRMLAPIALLGGANWLAYAIIGADEDKERKGMPEYLQGRTAVGTQKAVRMPFNVEDRPAFMDMSRRVPLGDLFDINNQTNGLPVPAPFMPSHPVISIMQAVLFNQDTFTGKDLVKKSDTAWEAAQARSGYLYRQFAPNAPLVPGSYNFNKLADSMAYTFDTEIGPYTGRTKEGDPMPLPTTLLDVFTGTKIRSFDPQRGVEYQGAGVSKEEKEIRANIRSANNNQSMTEGSRARYLAEQDRKLEELRQKREELRQ